MGQTMRYRLEVDPDTLRRIRISKALRQTDLSEISGVSLRTVTRAESGRHHVVIGNIRAIADALGVDPLDIARVVEEPE